ncbi:hypothetical protein EMCRGX_G007620 [Ephydatia muelleri]
MPLSVGDRVSCSASKVLGKKPAKQRFGRLSTTKELYGIVQKPEGTGRSVKYVVYFSEVEVTKAFSSCSLKRQATATNETNSNSDAHVPPSISAVEPASPALTRIAQQHEPDLEVDTTLSANVLHCHRIEWKVVDGILEDWRYISIWTSDHLPQGCVNAKEEEVLAVFGALYSLTRTSEGRRDLWSTITGEEEMSRYPDINEVASWELGYRLTAVGYDLSKHLHTSFQTVAVTTDYRTGERYGLTRDRFEILLRYLSFCPVHEVVDDKWAPVRHLIEGFNQRRVQKLYPGWQLCVDESVSSWRGKDGDFCSDGMPHVTRIERKPGVGCELKDCADADTKLLKLTKPWHGSGRAVSADSAFASVATAVACRKNGLHFTGLVKTATRMYPKQYIDEVEFQEIGDDITLTSNVEGHNIMAHAWGDKVRKCFVSTHSTTLPGKPSNKRRWREMLDEDEVGQTEVYNKTVKRKKVVESYFDAASIIDINNHMRQGGLALETAWRTQSWASLVVATVLGIVETDAYLLYKKFHPGGTRLSHSDFTEAVAKGLLLQNSVGIQATHARVETENAALPHNILPLSSLPMYNKNSEQCTDASDRGLGALPSQRDDSGSDHPVAYYSRKLLPREERYSTTAIEKECKEKYKSVDVPLPDLSNGLPVHR